MRFTLGLQLKPVVKEHLLHASNTGEFVKSSHYQSNIYDPNQ